MKQEEKRKKLAAAASLLEGRNADGSVSDLSCFHISDPLHSSTSLSLPPLLNYF